MVHYITALSTTSNQSPISQRPKGTGVIIQRGTHVSLVTDTDSLPLESSVLKVFKPNEQVYYELQQSTITLHSVEHTPTPSSNLYIPDAAFFTPTSNDSNTNTVSSAIILQQQYEPGLYFFTSITALLQFIGEEEQSAISVDLQKLLKANGGITVAVKVSPFHSDSGIIMPLDKAIPVLYSYSSHFKSDFLKKITPEQLLSICIDGKKLFTEKISAIDSLLADKNNHLPNTPHTGSASFRNELLQHWLNVTNLSDLSPQSSIALVPVFSGKDLITELISLSTHLPQYITHAIPDINLNVLSVSHLNKKNFKRTIEHIFSGLGINLERVLLSSNNNTTTSPNRDSIKASLLSMNQQIEQLYTLSHPLLPYDKNITNLDHPIPIPSDTNGQRNDFHTLLLTYVHELNSITESVDSFIKNTTTSLLSGIDASTPDTQMKINKTDTFLADQRMYNTLKNIFHFLQSVLPDEQSSPTDTSIKQQSGISNPQPSPLFTKNALQMLMDMHTSLFIDTAETTTSYHSTQTHPFSATQLFSIVKTLKELLLQLTVSTPFPSDSNNSAVRYSDQSVEKHIVTDTSEGMDFLSDSVLDEKDSLLLHVKKIITMIESFQISAKPVDRSDGTEQIIVLPLKIGHEVTDIAIRFHHFTKKHKRTAKRDTFAVDISVSPEMLGTIQTHIDYTCSKMLNITIYFERKNSMECFKRFEQEVYSTLQNHFTFSVSLTMKMINNNDMSRDKSNPNSICFIDVEA